MDIKPIVRKFEKTYNHLGKTIKYLYLPCLKKRKALIISFGSWPGPRYARIRDYYKNERNEYSFLYLQDGFGYKNEGVFYLAERGDFSVEETYTNLILKIIKKEKISKEEIFCLGSCMGGFAALYYAYKLNVGKVVAICPLINLRKLYEKSEEHNKLYSGIIGNSKLELDKYIFKNFDRHVDTTTHIVCQQNDKQVINGQLAKFVELMIVNNNKFTLKNWDLRSKENPHSRIYYYMDREKVMAKFNKELNISFMK